MSVVRNAIIEHFQREIDFNLLWRGHHLKDGRVDAAERRQDHVEKLQQWVMWLRAGAQVPPILRDAPSGAPQDEGGESAERVA